MRILHTADWHIGRRLGRHDRTEEMREALDEVARIADEERVDLVLVAGDVFDRAAPPVESLSLGLSALLRLARGRPVVVVAGNHDAPELFDALAPLLRDRGVHVIGRIKAPVMRKLNSTPCRAVALTRSQRPAPTFCAAIADAAMPTANAGIWM